MIKTKRGKHTKIKIQGEMLNRAQTENYLINYGVNFSRAYGLSNMLTKNNGITSKIACDLYIKLIEYVITKTVVTKGVNPKQAFNTLFDKIIQNNIDEEVKNHEIWSTIETLKPKLEPVLKPKLVNEEVKKSKSVIDQSMYISEEKIYSATVSKSRKEYICLKCNSEIHKNDMYWVENGSIKSNRYCLKCKEIHENKTLVSNL